MKHTDVKLAGGILVAGALVLAGSAATQPSRTPVVRATASYEEVACPPTVVRNAQHTASCGYLTVPENRSKANRQTIRLFVVRERPNGALRPDPVLALHELGSTRAWTGADYLPPRVHREVITVDHRGLGRSEPSLACPEVERLAASSMAAPINDRRTRAKLLPAVQACRDRLAAEGVDLAAYNVREIAADAEDLRLALGIERWNLRGLGSGARIAFEILRRDGAGVRAVWLDSPEIPQLDLLTTGVLGTRYATKALAAACATDRACIRRFPNVDRALASNLEAAERRPRVVRGRHEGASIPIAIDGGTSLRAHREGLAWAPELGPRAIAANSLRDARRGYDWISDGPLFTLGYGVDSGRGTVFAHGAWISTVCHDQLPFVSHAQLNEATRSAPAYREAFAQSPLADICRTWRVGRAAPYVRTAVRSNVPVLIFVGRFDPYGSPPIARQAARTLPRSWIVEIPAGGYNALAESYCALATRNAWIDRPTSPPDLTCVRRLPRIKFLFA
jgi:pimeloyl-ACP methyl ester carboxylesterase